MCSCCKLHPPFQLRVSFAFSAFHIKRGQKFKAGMIANSPGSPCVQRDGNLGDKPAPKPACPAMMGRGQKKNDRVTNDAVQGITQKKRWEVFFWGGQGI